VRSVAGGGGGAKGRSGEKGNDRICVAWGGNEDKVVP